jgi:aconitate hydratase
MMSDIWPSDQEIADIRNQVIVPEDYRATYATVFDGDAAWQDLKVPEGQLFQWSPNSTYVKEAPFFQGISEQLNDPKDILGGKVLLMLGDSITTDHISPAGSFKPDSPAGSYLIELGVEKGDFNSYGARRGNHEVMVRGTFANVRIKNQIVEKEGGWSLHQPSGEVSSVYEVSMRYQQEGVPLVVLGGKEYGSGSSRDWAAKGPNLLGIKVVIAESYERIHRSNLVGMGVLPLQFLEGQNAMSLGLSGLETFSVTGISRGLQPQQLLQVEAKKNDGHVISFQALSRLDSEIEIAYFKNGGILHYVLRDLLKKA